MISAEAQPPNIKECTICCNDYTSKKQFRCINCNFECCLKCEMYYIETGSSIEARCMNCNNIISNIYDIFTKNWCNNVFRKSRKEKLFMKEQGLIPKTLVEIDEMRYQEELKQRIEIKKQEMINFMSENDHVNDKLRRITSNIENCKLRNISLKHQHRFQLRIRNSDVERLNNELNDIQRELKEHLNERDDFMMTEYAEYREKLDQYALEIDQLHILTTIKRSPKQQVKLTYRCQTSDCLGFLDDLFSCLLCKKHFCKDCFREQTEGHECNNDDKITIALLKKDTKPCPKCSEMIHKISGCSQMFCLNCGTAFDWTTLRIETGLIHNPHAHDYFQNHPDAQEQYRRRNRNETNCNEPIPNNITVSTRLYGSYEMRILEGIRGDIGHFIMVTSNPIVERIRCDDIHNDYRFDFVTKRISDTDFKKKIHQRDKKISFEKDLHVIVMNTVLIIGNILWEIGKHSTEMDLIRYIEQINDICNSSNNMIQRLEINNFYKVRRRFIVKDEGRHPGLEFPKYW